MVFNSPAIIKIETTLAVKNTNQEPDFSQNF